MKLKVKFDTYFPRERYDMTPCGRRV